MFAGRGRSRIFVLLVGILLNLYGCQSVNHSLVRTDPSKDFSEYNGKVEPFVTPIVLRYKELPAFSLTLNLITADGKSASIKGRGSIVKAMTTNHEEEFLWAVAFNRVAFQGNEIETVTPFLSYKATSDECGKIGQEEVKVNTKVFSTSKAEHMENTFKQVSPYVIPPLPRFPLLVGDEITITSIGKATELAHTDFISKQDVPKSISMTKNTLKGTVIGVTFVNDQKNLVLKLHGHLGYALADIMTYLGTIEGYSLINTSNGMATATVFEYAYKVKDWAGNTSKEVKTYANIEVDPM